LIAIDTSFFCSPGTRSNKKNKEVNPNEKHTDCR
jgi:hypothetical protein